MIKASNKYQQRYRFMQIQEVNHKKYNVNFGNIKREKILAEKLLHKCKKMIPYTKSNSFVNAKINKYYNNDKYITLIEKLCDTSRRYSRKITESREKLCQNGKFTSFSALVKSILKIVKQNGYANCGEKNYILQNEFLKNKINAHAVKLQSYMRENGKKAFGKDHTFIVFNLKPDADLSLPSTWGSKAIVADAWCNIVMRAKDAIRYYKEFFGINTKKEFQLYECVDQIKIKDGIS